MKDWEKLVEQAPSEVHQKQVLADMDSLLEQNEVLAQDRSGSRARWLYIFAPVAAGVAVVAVLILSNSHFAHRDSGKADLAAGSPNLGIAMDYELLSDLQEIRYLNELQKLEDSKIWKSQKSSTKKL